MAKTIKKDFLKERLLDENTPFAIKESFNHLRTNIMYTTKDNTKCPVYAITSSGESAGKSTIIANLAISFAQVPKKVLLIDADMRCPVQNQIFRFPKEAIGLSELLSGIETDPKKAIRQSDIPSLDILGSGHIPPNPSELILSENFRKYIDMWKEEYDVIFIDCPPIGIVADSVALKDLVTGYIFVIRSNHSDARKINHAIESMENVGAKVLGVVLNSVNLKGSSNSYYYDGNYRKSHYAKSGSKKHRKSK
jgi:capsular exopolysaccharide synthesis family protein